MVGGMEERGGVGGGRRQGAKGGREGREGAEGGRRMRRRLGGTLLHLEPPLLHLPPASPEQMYPSSTYTSHRCVCMEHTRQQGSTGCWV